MVAMHWAALLLLAACAASGVPPPGDPVRVAPAEGAAWPPARGETELVVRAVARDAAGTEREIAGARCVASSPYYAAEFDAPARLLVPDFGAASPVVAVACRAGAAEGRAEARPELRGTGGLYGWPAVGISVGTGDYSGVGVGMGWYGGGTGWSGGDAAVRYPALRVAVQ